MYKKIVWLELIIKKIEQVYAWVVVILIIFNKRYSSGNSLQIFKPFTNIFKCVLYDFFTRKQFH